MNIGAFFSGDVPPYWPHAILIGASLLGSAAVTWGLIREEKLWSVTALLIVGGVIIEAMCTLLLFGFDEGISNAQQAKIALLESPRELTEQQAVAVGKVIRENFADMLFSAPAYDLEARQYAMQFCFASFGKGCNFVWVTNPSDRGSELLLPRWFREHENDPQKTAKLDSLLATFQPLGFLGVASGASPEYATWGDGERPVLYVAPKDWSDTLPAWVSDAQKNNGAR